MAEPASVAESSPPDAHEGRDSSRPPPALGGTPRRLPVGAWWLLLFALAVVELVGHFVIRARVPEDADWDQAAAFVRGEEQPRDLVEVAPAWADPVLRERLGDVMTLQEAAYSDRASFERLWLLSIRGADLADEPSMDPAVDRYFGRVRVRRWDLGPSPVLYDFVDHVRDARVTMVRGDVERPCPWQPRGTPRGGGLGAGAMTPGARHQCDPSRPWLWVGETVTEDLDLEPRRCIWQHPAGSAPVRATFEDVPLGDRLVFYGGIYYEHERMLEHGPIHVTIRIDGEEAGRMIHRDGDGWKRIEVDPQQVVPGDGARGDVTVEVTAPDPHLRTFCWSATTREGPRRETGE